MIIAIVTAVAPLPRDEPEGSVDLDIGKFNTPVQYKRCVPIGPVQIRAEG